jgi:hypothetical protein
MSAYLIEQSLSPEHHLSRVDLHEAVRGSPDIAFCVRELCVWDGLTPTRTKDWPPFLINPAPQPPALVHRAQDI